MSKQGLDKTKTKKLLKSITTNRGWTLCVGAGISVPNFPDWTELIEILFEISMPGNPNNSDVVKRLLNQYNADAIIQATQDKLNLDDNKFSNILSESLYSKIKSKLSAKEWECFVKFLSYNHVKTISPNYWLEFEKILDNYFSSTTAYKLSKIITEIYDTDFAPSSILSFNAETTFSAMINCMLRSKWEKENIGHSIFDQPKKKLDFITHSIVDRKSDRIQYYMCHGALPLPWRGKIPDTYHATDKLVFTESSYLGLSNSSFSWQSSTFLNTCVENVIVFIGVSLSDPNMRRWLSWVQQNKIDELNKLYAPHLRYSDSTRHYWINKKPNCSIETEWVESIVAHLGIRIIWIDDWTEIDFVVRNMLGL